MEEPMPDGCQEVLRVEISPENDDLLALHWQDAASSNGQSIASSQSSSLQSSLGLSRLVVIPHVASLEQNILGSLYRCGESGNYILKLSIFGTFASKKLLSVCLCLFGNAYIVGSEQDVIGIQEIATVLDSQIECYEITQQSYQTLITQDYQTLTEHACRNIYCDQQQLEKMFEDALNCQQQQAEEEADHCQDKENETLVIQGIYGKVQNRICEQLLGFRREELKVAVRAAPLTRSQLRAAKNKILAEQLSEVYKNGLDVNLKIVDRFDGWMGDVKQFNRLLTNTKCSQLILSEYRFLESKRSEYRSFEELIDDIELFYAFYIENCPDYAGKKLIILEFLTKALKDAAREFIAKDEQQQTEDHKRDDKRKVDQEEQQQQRSSINDSQGNEGISKMNDKNTTLLLSSFNAIDSTEQKEREAYYEGIMQQAHEQIEQFQRDILSNRQRYEQNIQQLKEQSDKSIQELQDRIKELESVNRKQQGNNRESTSKLEMDRLLLEQKVHFLEIELAEARKKAKGVFSFNQFLQENKHTQTTMNVAVGEQIGERKVIEQQQDGTEGQQLEEVRRELCFLSGMEMKAGEDEEDEQNEDGEEEDGDNNEDIEEEGDKSNQDNSRIKALEMQLQEKEHHLGFYTAQLENTCRRLSELEAKEQVFNEQHNEWEHLQNRIETQLAQIQSQQQSISSQSQEIYTMEQQLNELYSQLNEQSRRYTELEAELIETRDHNHQLSTHNSQYYHQIALYKQKALQAESLHVQLLEARNCQEKTERKLRESQQLFKGQVERIQEELMQRCTKEVQSKNAQILALTKHLAELDEQQQQHQQYYSGVSNSSSHNINNGRNTIGTGITTTIVDNHDEILENCINNSGNSRSSRSSHNNAGRNTHTTNTNCKEMSLSELVSVAPPPSSKQVQQSAVQIGLSTSQSSYLRSQKRAYSNQEQELQQHMTGGLSTKQSQIQQKELSFQQDDEDEEENHNEQQRNSSSNKHFMDQPSQQVSKNRNSSTSYSVKQQQELFSNHHHPRRDNHHSQHHHHNRSSSIQYSHTQAFYSQATAYPTQQYRSISENRDTNNHNDSSNSNNEDSSRLDSKESARIQDTNSHSNMPYATKSPQRSSNSSSQQLHLHSLHPQQQSLQYLKRESLMNSTPQGFLNNINNKEEQSPRLSNSQQLNSSNPNYQQQQLQLLRNKQSISSFNNELFTQDQQQINQYQHAEQRDYKQTTVDSSFPDSIISNTSDAQFKQNPSDYMNAKRRDNDNSGSNEDNNHLAQLQQGSQTLQEKQIPTVVGKSSPAVYITDNQDNNNHDSSYSTQQNQLSRVSSLSNVLDLLPMESSSKTTNNGLNQPASTKQDKQLQQLQESTGSANELPQVLSIRKHQSSNNHERNTYNNHSDMSNASNTNTSNLLLESFQPRTSERHNRNNNIFKNCDNSHANNAKDTNSESSSSGSQSSGSNYATTSYNIHAGGFKRQTSPQAQQDTTDNKPTNKKEISNPKNTHIISSNVATATTTLQKVNSMEHLIKASPLEVISKLHSNEKIMNIWGNSNSNTNNNSSRETLSWLTSQSPSIPTPASNLNSNHNPNLNIISPQPMMDTLGLPNSNQFNRQNLHSILHSIPSLVGTSTTGIDSNNSHSHAYHSTLLLQAEKSPRISTRTITDVSISNNNNGVSTTHYSYLNTAITPLNRVSSNKSPLHSNSNATLSSYQERSSYSSNHFRLPTHNFSTSTTHNNNNNIPNRFQSQISLITPQSRSVTPLHERKNTVYCADKALSPNNQQPSQFFTLNNSSIKPQTSIPKTFLKVTTKPDITSKDHNSNNCSNGSIMSSIPLSFFKRL